jgi:hypothetical protein
MYNGIVIIIGIPKSGRAAQLLPEGQGCGNTDVNPRQAGFVDGLLYVAQARIIGINKKAGEFGPPTLV